MKFSEFRASFLDDVKIDCLRISTEQHYKGCICNAPASFNSCDVEFYNLTSQGILLIDLEQQLIAYAYSL